MRCDVCGEPVCAEEDLTRIEWMPVDGFAVRVGWPASVCGDCLFESPELRKALAKEQKARARAVDTVRKVLL